MRADAGAATSQRPDNAKKPRPRPTPQEWEDLDGWLGSGFLGKRHRVRRQRRPADQGHSKYCPLRRQALCRPGRRACEKERGTTTNE